MLANPDGKRIGGARILAVVTSRQEGDERQYRLATERDYATVCDAQMAVAKLAQGVVPDEPLPPIGTLGFRVQRYGITKWGDLFTGRQKLTLVTLAAQVGRASQKAAADGRLSSALQATLAMAVSKQADYLTTLCTLRYHNR